MTTPVPINRLSAERLAAIPAGTVALRDARSGATRDVALEPFSIGRMPVTKTEWDSLFDGNGNGNGDTPAHPVTWFDAISWCNRASKAVGLTLAYSVQDRDIVWHLDADGFRLPTEAEWEWSCRAGTSGPRYGELKHIAWTAADHVEGPQEVAGKTPTCSAYST